MIKERVDLLMVERGLVESRSLAQKLVMAGQVRVNGQVVQKPSDKVTSDSVIVIDRGPKYVSRGGEKLEAALEAFGLGQLSGRVCADLGASTGGFSDCLLQHGAARVYAVDVGSGILHWKMRNDPRIIAMEKTNARNVRGFPEEISLVTVDASFISLKVLLPVIQKWPATGKVDVIALIKPQFEAGREEAARGAGVIRDPEVHRMVLTDVLSAAEGMGYDVLGLIRSPLVGPKGNVEFLVHLVFPGSNPENLAEFVSRVL